jgi:hypothetical protein
MVVTVELATVRDVALMALAISVISLYPLWLVIVTFSFMFVPVRVLLTSTTSTVINPLLDDKSGFNSVCRLVAKLVNSVD